MLDYLGTLCLFSSLHSANPGSTGSDELTGGTPTYARQALTWVPAVGGSKNLLDTPIFDVPPATTVAFVGLQSALTGGIWYGYIDVTDEVYAAQGTYQITAGTLDLNATLSA